MAELAPRTTAPATTTKTPAQSPSQAGLTAAAVGLQDSGAFILPIGDGVTLAPLAKGKASEIDKKLCPPLPGLTVEKITFSRASDDAMVSIKGTTAVPFTGPKPFALNFNKAGQPVEFKPTTKSTLAWIGNPNLTFGWAPDVGLTTELTVKAASFAPKGLEKLVTATGDTILTLAKGKLTGNFDTTIVLADVISAKIKGGFNDNGLFANIDLKSQSKFMDEVTGANKIDKDGNLLATIKKSAAQLKTPVKGLSFQDGNFDLTFNNDRSISGGFTNLKLDFAKLASATASFSVAAGKYIGKADLDMNIPGLTSVKGSIAMTESKLSGAFSLGKESFPKGLPLESGTISGTIGETGALAFAGSVGIGLGPAGKGELIAAYAPETGLSISAEVDLKVPGLQSAKVKIAYDGKTLRGSGALATDPKILAGLEGKMEIKYEEGQWSGETTLSYNADNGKLSGTITVKAVQDDKKAIKISGSGEVTAKIAPKLEGKLKASILESGGIDVSGSITVTEPIEMFPEKRFEKELINKSTSIPLWAILVAVMRIRAGVRAGIGPGVFRNITVTGSYSIGKEGEPSFAINGEMYIPTFVEGYVGFGAGLGLNVGLGALTGGIEAMGTAGVYGAISVIPELAYKDGDYSISGQATMAAGARLKLSLNAWAEIEALWVTVWDKTWELAAVTMPIGPDLGLSAKMDYTFGKGEAPTLEFSTSDVDTDKLIADAMPKDGPPSAGVKEETKNAAKWAGAQKAKGPAADKAPSASGQKSKTDNPALGDKAKKEKKAAKKDAQPNGKDKTLETKTGAPADAAKSDKQLKDAANPDAKAKGTVASDKVASTKTPRHPAQVTLAMLAEPPAPMPRSKEQQEADIDAAANMVKLVADNSDDTDSLDDNFAKIKSRFVVSSIAYQVDPGPEVSIKVSANPDRIIKLNETIHNLPLGSYDKDADNKIEFTKANREWDLGNGQKVTDSVGVKMVASVLTPLHAKGSGPRDDALKNIFKHLETQGDTGAHGYIKGHLLNDNLGGPGSSENLYPITQQANADHHSMIENEAKALVNDQHYWVRYEVEIGNEKVSDVSGPPGGPKVIAIDADMKATLSKLHTDKTNFTKVKSVVIKSRFNMSADPFKGKTSKQLTPAEQAARDKNKKDHLDQPDSNSNPAGLTGQTNRSYEEQLPADQNAGTANFMQTTVDQTKVQLSSAKGKSDKLVLDQSLRKALIQLATPANRATPFAGSSTLAQRLKSAVTSTTSHDILLGLNSAAEAASLKSPDRDIAESDLLTAPQLATLRQINSAATATTLTTLLAEMDQQRQAAARLSAKGNALTKVDWNFLASKMQNAKDADRLAFAAQVVTTYGTPAAGREAMQAAGIWESKDPFFSAVRAKIPAK